jgi:S1-C subfamily serine protease
MSERFECPNCHYEFVPSRAPTSVEEAAAEDVESEPQTAIKPSPPRRKSRRKTRLGLAIRGLGVVAVVALAAVILWKNVDVRWWRGRVQPSAIRAGALPPTVVREAAPADEAMSAALSVVENSIVLIEADGPAGLQSIGSGFVIDPAGGIATSFHVATELVQGAARFQDGRVFEIAGYSALDTDNDLAILKLATGGATLTPVKLATADPQPLDPIVAIGHPQGVEFSPFDGKVSRLVRSSQLPLASQRFVRLLTGSEQDHVWIQHTAQLSGGNSGGPLVDRAGAVLGVNTWVDQQTGFGYAVHAAALAELIKHPLPKVEPLERHASTDARLRALVWRTSAEELRELLEQARSMNWSPASRTEYGRLQKLAWAVTVANQPDLFSVRSSLGDKLDALVRQADQVVRELRQQKWNEPGQIILLNEYADGEIARPMAGLIFFGSIERIVEGSPDERAAIVRLAGFDRRVLVPLKGRLKIPEAGQQCLVVGVNDRGRTASMGDNPLRQTVLPIVNAPLLLPLTAD